MSPVWLLVLEASGRDDWLKRGDKGRVRLVIIRVPEDVYHRLEEYRRSHGFRDLVDVIVHLLELSRVFEEPCRIDVPEYSIYA